MQLRLELPFVSKQIQQGSRGSLVRWHVREGDRLDFGTELCDVVITEITDRYAFEESRPEQQQVQVFVRITASDSGVLRRIEAAEGSSIAVGDLLGVVSTEPAELVDGSPAPGAPALRVVANVVDAPQATTTERPPRDLRSLERWSRQALRRPVRALRAFRRTIQVSRGVSRGDGYVQWSGPGFTVVRSTANPEPKTGIYLKGACDLPHLLSLGPLLQERPRGTVVLANAAYNISASRADVLLQTLEELSPAITKETSTRLRLPDDYFRPTLFSPTFTLPELPRLGPVPKTVVVLSLAPNIVRTLYRHREHGYLVDPGGFWLNQVEQAIRDQKTVAWFQENFRKAGRLSVDEFAELFEKLIPLVKERTGAQHVLVFNVLTVEPGDRVHNYQLKRNPEVLRRREFCLALTDLSRRLGFHIVDIDRILKREGIARQVDFAHFPDDLGPPIAAEAFRIMQQLEVV